MLDITKNFCPCGNIYKWDKAHRHQFCISGEILNHLPHFKNIPLPTKIYDKINLMWIDIDANWSNTDKCQDMYLHGEKVWKEENSIIYITVRKDAIYVQILPANKLNRRL